MLPPPSLATLGDPHEQFRIRRSTPSKLKWKSASTEMSNLCNWETIGLMNSTKLSFCMFLHVCFKAAMYVLVGCLSHHFEQVIL